MPALLVRTMRSAHALSVGRESAAIFLFEHFLPRPEGTDRAPGEPVLEHVEMEVPAARDVDRHRPRGEAAVGEDEQGLLAVRLQLPAHFGRSAVLLMPIEDKAVRRLGGEDLAFRLQAFILTELAIM